MQKKDIKKIAREYLANELRVVYRYYKIHTSDVQKTETTSLPRSEHWIP